VLNFRKPQFKRFNPALERKVSSFPTRKKNMKYSFKYLAVVAAAIGAIAVAPAQAQNPGYSFGDLMLGFQTTGAGNGSFVLVNLGPAATLRDGTSNVSLVNVNAALTAQFGAGWQERTDLYMGAVTVWNADAFNEDLLNGDPTYTLYVSNPRTAVGTAGSPNSGAYSLTENQTTQAGDAAFGIATDFENRGGSGISTLTNAGSFIDYVDQNPISAGVQQTALGVFPAGIQFAFAPGSFGTLGGVDAEAALDLYRIQYRNDIPGQFGLGDPNFQGSYQGTILIDSLGNTSFIVVPEPSTYALLGLAAVLAGVIAWRQRPAAV